MGTIRPPRQRRARLLRKRTDVRCSDEYFEQNRRDFLPSFLSKSTVERSGILSKLWRKTAVSKRQLAGIHRVFIRIHERRKRNNGDVSPEDKDKVVKMADVARKIFGSMAKQNQQIFSLDYMEKIGLEHGRDVHSAHMRDFHECVHQMIDIRNYYRALANPAD
jgi:hypothetical protein